MSGDQRTPARVFSRSRPQSPYVPPSGAAVSSHSNDRVAELLLALLPLSNLYNASFVGQLFGVELLFFLLLPILLLLSKWELANSSRTTVKILALWFLIQIATDIAQDISLGDLLRGWAKLLAFALDYYVLSKLLTTPRRLLAFLLGWSVVYPFNSSLEEFDFATDWKFGIGFAIPIASASALLLLLPTRIRLIAALVSIICMADAIVSLALTARNNFLAEFVAAVLLASTLFSPTRRILHIAIIRYPIAGVAGGLLAIYLAGLAYVTLAESGTLGSTAYEKLQTQQVRGVDPVLGLFIGGRSEYNTSFVAIKDSPIFGHGSWFRSAYYYSYYVDSVHQFGSPEQINQVDSTVSVGEPLVPTHSHLFGSWVESGIIGAVFWLLALWTSFRALQRSVDLTSTIHVIVIVTFFQFVWNILFSPFGGSARLSAAVLIVLYQAACRSNDWVSRSGETEGPRKSTTKSL